MVIEESADGRTIELRVGQELELRLAENPTTGYRWQLESTGEPACALLDDIFAPPAAGYGRGGSHSWHFRARQAGEGRIALAIRRGRDSGGSAARTFAVAVRVADR
jgi:inhibitor of cysteine peptidase